MKNFSRTRNQISLPQANMTKRRFSWKVQLTLSRFQYKPISSELLTATIPKHHYNLLQKDCGTQLSQAGCFTRAADERQIFVDGITQHCSLPPRTTASYTPKAQNIYHLKQTRSTNRTVVGVRQRGTHSASQLLSNPSIGPKRILQNVCIGARTGVEHVGHTVHVKDLQEKTFVHAQISVPSSQH